MARKSHFGGKKVVLHTTSSYYPTAPAFGGLVRGCGGGGATAAHKILMVVKVQVLLGIPGLLTEKKGTKINYFFQHV